MAPQDSFIEEEEDVCPLCIEDLDLSDRNFRPCPCGYQVCQFCFNNIKNNMNGLCPACRRPYDEKTIEWKVVTSEEVAEFRANIQKNQKKRAQDQRHKEVQKREVERENRKNLIGVRVVQKNLVYITGLAPTIREDELLKTLRKPEFFGQYGNIQKISISNRKSSDGQHQSLGIYVTFEKPEEAIRCIQAVHGSHNGDRVLKAQHGTTKYCSAWLKNEKCSNPGCMFLHEQGDEEDSYTRQDLSSMNSIHTQRPLLGGGGSSSRSASRQQNPPQPAQAPPPPAAQAMARSSSKEGSENGVDSSALPSSANWARNPQRSRRGSLATSGAASSPAVSMSLPATTEVQEAAEDAEESAPQQASSSQSAEPEVAAQPATDATLLALLKALEACTLPNLSGPDADDMAPPMFDVRGGEKRKAMREDEDAQLGEQEDQAEAREASEGDPETGGSLALGGEPEDREISGDAPGFEQRRSSTQPPIQRNNTDGIFGPPLGGSFNAGPSNLVGRTMTPQQLFSMRSQGGYADQMPPGISGQNNAFHNQGQGQGHNRQSSRFSFANDNTTSGTNVKLAANPRIMAQQSSMMPSSFQSQGGNQFYQTSMPGPPPGLKSTGTPPNMFGQGFGGSSFGGAPKDSSNDLLQSLIGRNRGGNNQAHDAGKREYMIPSFSNQYPPPSTSSPAPAPGLLASLYGNQPGQFQDFGSKQKKKGKKHRHANTSSSGGSGLVDLADPSILQARMQHQSQSNAGAGQGLFGGQGQDDELVDDELPSLDEASNSVDALVSDEPLESGFTAASTVRGLTASREQTTPVMRPASTTQGQPRLGHIIPALPKVPPPGLSHGTVTPEQTPRKQGPPGLDAKKDIKALAVESGLSSAISSHAHPEQAKESALQEEDFPALDAPKTTKQTPAVPTPKATPASKKHADKSTDKTQEKLVESPEPAAARVAKAEKRPIAVNTQVAKATAHQPGESSATTEKSNADSTAFPALPAASSPAPRAAPKTLRVLPTPKAEVPPLTFPMPTGASMVPSVISRSVSVSQRPETPASEMVSETGSVVSASVSASRAGSPPPSRIGSAAVRATTKSQQRKQRKEALKQDTKVMAEVPVKPESEEHAPVIGRKKKQKKEKAPKASNAQPEASTSAKATAEKTPSTADVKDTKDEKAEQDLPKAKSAQAKKSAKSKGKEKEKQKEPEQEKLPEKEIPPTPASPAQEPPPAQPEESPETPDLEPAPVFTEIKRSLWTSAIDKLQILRPINSSLRGENGQNGAPANKPGQCKDMPCKCGEIQDSDLAALRAGKPVRKQFHVDGSRMLITPNGDCIRGLNPEEEEIFLGLQASIARSADSPGAFVAQRHQPGSGAFSLIKGRAVPNGRPNIFPVTSAPQSQDPISKLQREDALSYINQYVLPRLNLGSSNVSFPKGSSPTRDAAASLNSLAPYFYGPDAAAGVGIYSSGDGTRSIPEFGVPAALHEDGGKTPGVGGMPLMSVEDAESALAAARKETEKLEKGLNSVIKRNRRLMIGSGS